MNNGRKKKLFGIYLPIDLQEQIKIISEKNMISSSAFIRLAILEKIKKDGN